MNKYVAKVEAVLSESPVLTKVLYFIGFITSGYITWEALSAKSNSPYVWLAYTIVMEYGKAISYLHFVKTKKKNFFTMWMVLTFFSIAASMTFLVIENNVAENRSRTSSLSYQQAQDKANRIKEQISIKQQILAQTGKDKEDSKKLTEEYNKSINSVQATINAKQNELKAAAQNKWTTTQTRLKEEINQLKDKQNKDIKARDNLSINADTSKISSEIDNLNSQLNNIDFSALPQEKATSGFFALFQFLGFGTFWIEFFFTLALTATFEILICMLYSLSKTGHFPTLNPNNPNNPDKMKVPELEKKENKTKKYFPKHNKIPQFSMKKTGNVTEFKPRIVKSESGSQIIGLENNLKKQPEKQPENNLTNEMKNYLKIAKNNLKENGDLPSRQDMSKLTGYSPEKCRTLHNKLKEFGILQTELKPRRTYIVDKKVVV